MARVGTVDAAQARAASSRGYSKRGGLDVTPTRVTRFACRLLSGVGFLVLGACGSRARSLGDTGSDGGLVDAVTSPSASEACADFASAVCMQMATCTPFALPVTYGSEAECVSRIELACLSTAGAPGNQGTPEQMVACAGAVEEESCDEFLDNSQPSACNVPGTAPTGATCGANAQCASSYCKAIAGTVCGTCTAHALSGGSCGADADCAATLVCNGSTCVTPVSLQASCNTTQPCLRTLTCIDGVCLAPVAVGGTCDAATDCDGLQGLYCATNKTCTQAQVAQDGAPCGDVSGTLVACSGGATCANVSNEQGVCHPAAADDGVCGPNVGCVAPAVCTATARCTLPDPATCD